MKPTKLTDSLMLKGVLVRLIDIVASGVYGRDWQPFDLP